MDDINIEIDVGDIVYSRAGRDKGKYYVVMWVDKNFIGICDGFIRKIDKIKKKKNKHVLLVKKSKLDLKKKILLKEKISNSKIKKIISDFNLSECL